MLPQCLVDVPVFILFLGQLPSHQDLAFTPAIQRSVLSSQSQGQGKGNWRNKERVLKQELEGNECVVCCNSRDQGLGLFLFSVTYSDSGKLRLLQSLFVGRGKHSLFFTSVANTTALI